MTLLNQKKKEKSRLPFVVRYCTMSVSHQLNIAVAYIAFPTELRYLQYLVFVMNSVPNMIPNMIYLHPKDLQYSLLQHQLARLEKQKQ